MTVNFFLIRHGNTFDSGETPYWIGEKEDLPLTSRGIEQAAEVGEYLLVHCSRPVAIFSGTLRRTSAFAKIIKEKLDSSVPLIEDARLNEIDYGEWAGRTDEEIAGKYGELPLRLWRERGQWPQQGKWGATEQQVKHEVEDFALFCSNQFADNSDIVVVSSNGRLRYFLTLIQGEFERRADSGELKMGTGRVSLLTCNRGAFSVHFWNKSPREN